MQKIILTLLLLCIGYVLWSQLKVTSPEPDVIPDSRKTLFYGYDNLVTITTGDRKDLTVSVKNGRIKKADMPGKFYVWPNDYSTDTVTIILTSKNFKKQIEYRVLSLPDPEVDYAGQTNEDGVITNFRLTRGIRIRYERNDLFREFKIDSFTITFKDSVSEVKHKNLGSAWDIQTNSLIQNSRHGTLVIISEIFVSMNGIKRELFSMPKVSWIK